ncbi:MAG: hypothetical protein K9J06_06045 [Flavobacteriales bacterium]|nr:hypothetical protein [Flavobacteriales bacterium]
MELNETQMELVSAYIRQNGVAYDGLHDDLLDHICTGIENRMRQGDSFEDAFLHTVRLFGPGGLMQVQQDTFQLLTEINATMKKVTFTFGLTSTFLLLAGTIFKLMHWPGASIMIVLGAGLLVLAYLPLILHYKLKESPSNEYIMHISGWVGLSFSVLGVLFKVMHWPGAGAILLGGMAVLAFLYVPIYFYKQYHTSVNRPVTLSTSMVAMTCLILVFALARINPSLNYELGSTMIDDELRASASAASTNQLLYADLGSNASAQVLKERTDAVYDYIDDLKATIVFETEDVTEAEARTLPLAQMKNKANFDITTHLMFHPEAPGRFDHTQLVKELEGLRQTVLATYPPHMQARMAATFPYDLGRPYEKQGNQQDWAHYHFYHVPLVGVISYLSKLQNDIRQAENQALVHLLSQPEVSNPPS